MNQLLTFNLGEELCGLEIDRVQEVLLAPRLNPVPRAPAWVAGAINLHGSPRAVVDLAAFLGMTEAVPDTRIIALTPGSSGLALAVTRLGGIVSCTEDTLLPLQGKAEDGYVRAVLPHQGRMVGLLDLEAILQRLDQTLGRRSGWL